MIRVLWLILWKSSVINLLLISQYYNVLGITVPLAQCWGFQSLTRTTYSKDSLGLWHQWYGGTVVEPLVWQGRGLAHHWSCLCCILAIPCPSFPSIFPSDSALPPSSILTKSKLSSLCCPQAGSPLFAFPSSWGWQRCLLAFFYKLIFSLTLIS